MNFLLLFSRQGKIRLHRWYQAYSEKERRKILKDVPYIVCNRKPRMSNVVEWSNGLKLVYKRYASLIFCVAVENEDNELLVLEIIHRYVELLDAYFGNVCELDVIFNFEKAYHILDEFILGGYVQESSRKLCLDAMCEADLLAGEVDVKKILEEVGLY
ncbi:AP-1 complex subunit sigma-2-like [Symsagittifera roscoffensis]|uniref:AP-1 complex subunit sigma-2-like n=1 Tax=Symsagittifera roscoffensis TaxID=84072 RepID=UPI00307BCB81